MKLTAALHITSARFPTRPTLHNWPGETSDDYEADDFEDDGTEDLPGLRMGHFGCHMIPFREKNIRHTGHTG
jgi:hypothetical protein